MPLKDAYTVIKKKKFEEGGGSNIPSCHSIFSCSSTHSLLSFSSYSFCLVVFTLLGLSSLSHPSLLKHPLSCSLMETYRAFLWALIPCKHRLPGQNLHCVSEDLFSASSVKHCPPRVVFLWNLCLTTQDFNSSQGSAGPIRLCYCGSPSLPVFFGRSFINFPKLFLELGSECPWRNEQAANRLQKKTATLFKVVLLLHPPKQYQHSTKTGSTHTCRPQDSGAAAG